MTYITKPPNVAHVGVQGVSATAPYVLVDLSDTTNYTHTGTTAIHLKGLFINTEKKGAGVYDIWAGVLTENDSDNGSLDYFELFHIETIHVADSDTTPTTDRMNIQRDYTLGGANPQGLNLQVTSGATPYLTTNEVLAGNSALLNSTNRVGAGDDSTKLAAGDLVLYIEEVSGTGTLDFSATAIYDTV